MGNKTALGMAGVEEREVVGKLFWETPWWAHSSQVGLEVREAIERAREGEFVRFETTHPGPSGEIRHIDFTIRPVFDDHGAVIYMVPEGFDITERKAIEESLRKSEARYRATIENAADAFFLTDGQGKIVDVNQSACDSLGYQREELLSMRVTDVDVVTQEEEFEGIWTALTSNVIAGKSVTREGLHRRRDGTTFPVEVRVGPLKLGDDLLLLALVRDITERKNAEKQREELETRLRQAQKMEAIGLLAGGVAHDFNNILHVILGFSGQAMEKTGPESPIREELSQVIEAGQRATTLVKQLLAFGRRQVLKLEVLDLDDIVDNLSKMIRRLIGEHISFSIRTEPGNRSIHADRGEIEQILINLCINSRDAMPEGGLLTIETEDVTVDAASSRENEWAEPGRFVLLRVSDTGCGIDEETQRRIFEPFFTTKGEGRGTGLGLSTAYGIVRQHNGMIRVSSVVGQGTTFEIYLPASTSIVEATPAVEETIPDGGTEVILLAEDYEIVRNLTVQVLEDAGYTVLAARDGEEAIRQYEEHVDEVDLLLLDVVMPALGGHAVFDRIRKAGSRTPILFSSGYAPDGVHTNFVLDEGTQYLQKPYTRDDLLRLVRQALDSEDEGR
jgi:PAS domain S-box-containing protein